MPPSITPHVAPGIRTRSGKACTTCRQVKLRCDAATTFPGPCTRCRSTGRVCTVNPSFKRTPTRNQIENLAQQVDSLRNLVGTSSASIRETAPRVARLNRLSSLQSEDNSSSGANEKSLLVSEMEIQEVDDIFGLEAASSGDLISPSHFGDVEFTSNDFLELFDFFARNQYYHLPILDTRTPIGTIQKDTPILFWSIIAATCRFHPKHCEKASLLKYPFNKLLGNALTTSPMSLRTIQAILISCYWPLSCNAQPQDPSWIHCGSAINAALYLGLNSPKVHRPSNISAEERNIRSRTWLGCFYICLSLSVYLGAEPPIQSPSSLANIAHMVESVAMPQTFAAHVDIQRHVARYRAALTSERENSFNISAMKIFERELDSIPLRYKSTWNSETEFSLLKAKLSLHALVCIGNQTLESSAPLPAGLPDNDHNLDMSKLSGLYFASKMLRIYSDIVDSKAATMQSSPHRYLELRNPVIPCIPKFYTRDMTFATLFLLNFCVFNSRLSQNDRDTAENSIKMAYRTFVSTSTSPLDENDRAAKVIEVLSKAGESNLRIRDRLDASIIFDSLHRAAELRGRETDKPIPEITLTESLATSDKIPGEVSANIMLSNSAMPSLDILDPWISYMGLPGEPWPYGDIDT